MDTEQTMSGRLITPEALEHLPEPVQRYMAFSGIVGKPWIDTVHLKYAGRFRLGAGQGWMPMTAEQVYTTDPPGFLWKARFRIGGLPLMRALDSYKGGGGHMFGKLGPFTIFDERGEKLDQGAMMRYLNEITWFPTAYLGDNVEWQGVDAHCALVTLTDRGKSVSARMVFDDAGRPVNFIAQRYREDHRNYTLDTWSTPFTKYAVHQGLHLPICGQGVWNLPGGDLPYIDVNLSEIEYNCPIPSF
jgi:hypothetical protein